MPRRRSRGRFVRVLILLLFAGIVFGGFAAFRAGPEPVVTISAGLPGIGKRTPIQITLEEPKRGLADYRVELAQGDWVVPLEERAHTPLQSWQLWGPRTPRDELTVEVGREINERLREGTATVRVIAERAGAYLRRPQPVTQELELPVKLRPPSLQVMSTHTYLSQGGSEAVVYRVGESSIEDGVMSGSWWFPGNPLPGGDERDRFALVGAPFDLSDPEQIRLIARDDVGNEARVAFIERYNPRPFKADTIHISDDFMARVVPAILSQTPEMSDKGNLLDNYLAINNELRASNAETLTQLSARSVPEFLWKRRFLQMPNAKVMSNFADRRTYMYDGQSVDQQDHLGFDLASTSRAEIPAANDGTVVLARYFGIYGNAVVIDHGFGLLSLYGHLSNLAVEEGQKVERGQAIGRSGATGLAGGDHLHFTILLHGLAVNPREWWDGHWIHDRLELKLGDALPFGS